MSPPNHQLDLFSDFSAFEGTDVEYKSARGGLPNDLWETYSAFANTDGGTVYLGIAQRDQGLDIHGLDDVDRLLSNFWNTVNNKSKVSRNLLSNRDVELLALDDTDRKVIAIHVPRAGRQDRPVYIGTNPFAGTFRRNHEGDYRCQDAEVRRMFADHSDEPPDSRIMEGFSLDDLHLDSLRQYRNRFLSRAPGHPWLAKDDVGLLEQLGGWRRERKGAKEGITLAALLMFGKTLSIQAPEAIPGFQLDYRERLSDDPNIRWSDRLTIDGTWEANLFQFYQQVMLRFASDAGLKRPFAQDSEGVRPLVTPVHDALQEALVNALIHGDYSGQGGVVIERYTDRFEFSNPGTLLVSLEQILRGSVSECRNSSLQRMFQMLGVGDKAGSGIDKIRTSWAAQHWQSPRMEETQRPDRVKLSLPMVSMLPESALVALEERYGSRFRLLGKDAVQTLVTAETEGSVSNQRLQEILTLHRRDITLLLQALVRDGFLIPDRYGRWTRYSVVDPFEPVSVSLGRISSPDKPLSSPDKPLSSPD
ncbi:MAG: putative DNA binding domain-containing protein, partial [Xanthomonadales bacterium]|nr:putative DNA binding domain-containing protein [Xanthomonadales bacterium]